MRAFRITATAVSLPKIRSNLVWRPVPSTIMRAFHFAAAACTRSAGVPVNARTTHDSDPGTSFNESRIRSCSSRRVCSSIAGGGRSVTRADRLCGNGAATPRATTAAPCIAASAAATINAPRDSSSPAVATRIGRSDAGAFVSARRERVATVVIDAFPRLDLQSSARPAPPPTRRHGSPCGESARRGWRHTRRPRLPRARRRRR